MTINLDDTKALQKIADELGAIDQTLNSLMLAVSEIAVAETTVLNLVAGLPDKTGGEQEGGE